MHMHQWTCLAGAAASSSVASWLGQRSPKGVQHCTNRGPPRIGGGQLRSNPTRRHGSLVDASSFPASSADNKTLHQLSIDTAARCISAKAPKQTASGKAPRLAGSKTVPVDCGEDAFFLAMPDSISHFFFGVADGVGGWADVGIDPALFAWDLMSSCAAEAEGSSPSSQADGAALRAQVDPKLLLTKAFDSAIDSGVMSYGSSTACVASLDCLTAKLEVANLGDSGVLVLRGESLILESREQHHSFNCPYQLACNPPGDVDAGDPPEDADKYSVDVKNGDVVLIATDGFFDNVHKDEIIQLTSSMREHNAGAEDIADLLIKYAHEKSREETGHSPFACAAQRHGYFYEGGKTDDITLVVTQIS